MRYAHNGDVAIAYQVFGAGTHKSRMRPGFHLQLVLGLGAARVQEDAYRAGPIRPCCHPGRRGIGLSDRLYPKDLPPLEVVMDDILTVMDDAGIERAALFGGKAVPPTRPCWRRPTLTGSRSW